MKCTLCVRLPLHAKHHISESAQPPVGALSHPYTQRVEPRPQEVLQVDQTEHGRVSTRFFSVHRPWLITVVLSLPHSPSPTRGPLTLLPPQGCPPGPSCAEVSPAVLSQGAIHPGGLLIETMCAGARQGHGGGSSGSQAWPGACGCWEDWGRRA